MIPCLASSVLLSFIILLFIAEKDNNNTLVVPAQPASHRNLRACPHSLLICREESKRKKDGEAKASLLREEAFHARQKAKMEIVGAKEAEEREKERLQDEKEFAIYEAEKSRRERIRALRKRLRDEGWDPALLEEIASIKREGTTDPLYGRAVSDLDESIKALKLLTSVDTTSLNPLRRQGRARLREIMMSREAEALEQAEAQAAVRRERANEFAKRLSELPPCTYFGHCGVIYLPLMNFTYSYIFSRF